jgi:MFS family permease
VSATQTDIDSLYKMLRQDKNDFLVGSPSPIGPSLVPTLAPLMDIVLGPQINDRKRRSNIPSLVVAFMASLTTGGTTYAFGLYGADLKKTLHLKPSELDSISTAFFVAGLFSWIPGLIADKFGTRFSMACGGIQGATSLLLYWLVSKQYWPLPHSTLVPILSTLGIFIFLSCALVTGSVFKIIVASCGPTTKGSAVGAAKGYVGLGAGAYACLFEAIRGPNETFLDFMPMAAFFFVACATFPALVLLPTKQQLVFDIFDDETTSAHFNRLYMSLCGMATLIVTTSMLALYGSDNKEQAPRNLLLAIVIVGVWLGPVISLLFMPRKRESDAAIQLDTQDESVGRVSTTDDILHDRGDMEIVQTCSADGGVVDEGVSLLHVRENGDADDDIVDDDNRSIDNENFNLLEMIRTPTCISMLWTCTILVGAGTVETNNMGEMVEALGFPQAVTGAGLALFSVAQAGARVATGAISDSALNWNTNRFGIDKGIPRPFFLLVASVVGFVAHGVLGTVSHKFGFVLGSTLAGAAFGMVWPLMVLVTGEVFGVANAGANYMFFDGFSSATGTLLLTKGLSQSIYTEHIRPDATDQNTCLGMRCFQMTHLIVSLLSLTCVGTSLATLLLTRRIYNKISLHA